MFPKNHEDIERLLLLELEEIDRARQTLIDFTLYTKPDYQVNWHHRLIAKYLDLFLAKKIKNLMIFCPPRHGKSELVSRRFPAYCLGKNPNINIISTSYAASLSGGLNRDVQRIIDSPEYYRIFPNTKLFQSSDKFLAKPKGTWLRNSEIFEIVSYSGIYKSAGIGGGITGYGSNIGIIDDPIKDAEEALSVTIREKHWEWYTSTFESRLEKDGQVLLTMTRWHEDDLAGRLIEYWEKNGDKEEWTILNLPAILEEETEYDPRLLGEALWPEKKDLETLNKIKSKSNRVWISLYQQRPSALEGNIFKRNDFRFYQVLPKNFTTIRQYWDMSFKKGPDNSYVVGQVWGKVDGKLYLIHQFRKQIGFTETQRAVASVTMQFPKATKKVIEDKANGTAIMDSMRKKISGMVAYDPGTDSKESRWVAASPVVESGCVYLPDPVQQPWVNDFLDEVTSVPNSKFNDQADTMTMAIFDLEKDSIEDLKAFLGM